MRWRCPTCDRTFHSYRTAEAHLAVDCVRLDETRLTAPEHVHRESRAPEDEDCAAAAPARACVRPGFGWMRQSAYFREQER